MQKIIDSINAVASDIAKDLPGYAARAALKELTTNWQDAVNDHHPTFDVASMEEDISTLIDHLLAIKSGLSHHSNAEANMRRDLGLDFELPSFDQSDDQLTWVAHIRESYPKLDSKEVFRLAEAEYRLHDGKLAAIDDESMPD